MPTSNSSIVEVQDLSRVFGKGPSARTVLSDIEMHVEPQDFLAIVGPSGSGKSTLLGILGGLDQGYQGKVRLFGQSLEALSDRQLSRLRGQQLGFVFQAFHLLDQLSVLDNVLVPSLFSPRPCSRAQALSALGRVALADRSEDSTALLSGGQRQRVAIARALVHKPALLLCDEPTGNLDRATAQQILEIFTDLNETDGTTVLCATHDPTIAQKAKRVVQLHEGRLVKSESNG